MRVGVLSVGLPTFQDLEKGMFRACGRHAFYLYASVRSLRLELESDWLLRTWRCFFLLPMPRAADIDTVCMRASRLCVTGTFGRKCAVGPGRCDLDIVVDAIPRGIDTVHVQTRDLQLSPCPRCRRLQGLGEMAWWV